MKLLILMLAACVDQPIVDRLPSFGTRYTCTIKVNDGCTVEAPDPVCTADYLDAWQPIADACLEAACDCLITCDGDTLPCVL